MRRIGWALLVVAGLILAALASMVRIVDVKQPAVVAPAPARSTPQASGHGRLLVPVRDVPRSAIRDSWGEARDEGARGHQAIDIPAPPGTPVLAAAPGIVEKLYFSNGGGGISLYVRSPDRMWSYYYAHLQRYAPGMAEGKQVRAGETIGYVGDTGNAGVGNYHLHFAMARMGPTDRWWQGEPVNPHPLLSGR